MPVQIRETDLRPEKKTRRPLQDRLDIEMGEEERIRDYGRLAMLGATGDVSHAPMPPRQVTCMFGAQL